MMLYRNFSRAAPSGDRWWHKGTSLSQFEVSAAHFVASLLILATFRKKSGKKNMGLTSATASLILWGPLARPIET
jgi:hypothetical protein